MDSHLKKKNGKQIMNVSPLIVLVQIPFSSKASAFSISQTMKAEEDLCRETGSHQQAAVQHWSGVHMSKDS